MRIDPSLFKNDNVDNDPPDHGVPSIVLVAVAVFSLLFLGGGLYLFLSGPFTGIDIIEPAQLAPATVAVVEHNGPIWGLEKTRNIVKKELSDQGWLIGEAITIFPTTPFRMRPIKVTCQVGYLLGLGSPKTGDFDQMKIKTIDPGRRLVVKVFGKGNFSGNKAYKAAEKLLRSKGLALGQGQRFEIKRHYKHEHPQIEHWIPVQ